MMDSITSRQFNEWYAYEKMVGPLDNVWRDEVAAQTHELIQLNNRLAGAAISGKGHKNPAPKMKRVPRPTDMFNEESEDEDDDEDGE